MVGTEEREQVDSYYSPNRIHRWLREWALLVSLAETPRSSRHYLTLEHRFNRNVPCPEPFHPEQRGPGYHGDDLGYADIQADIERAWNGLHPTTREFRAVYLAMQGYRFREIGELLEIGTMTASRAYWAAVGVMATCLGWRGE